MAPEARRELLRDWARIGALGVLLTTSSVAACGDNANASKQPRGQGGASAAAGAPGNSGVSAGGAGSKTAGGVAPGAAAGEAGNGLGATLADGGLASVSGGAAGEGGDASTAHLLVVSTDPADASLEAEPDGSVVVELSQLVNSATVTQDTVRLRDVLLDEVVPVQLAVSGATLSIKPGARLGLVAEYEVTLDHSIAGMAGLTLGQNFTFSFLVRDGSWHETAVSTDKMSPLGPTLGLDRNGTAFVSWVTRTETAYCPAKVRRFPLDGATDAAFSLTATTTLSECRSPRAAAAGLGFGAAAWEEDTGVYVTQYREGNWIASEPLIGYYTGDLVTLAALPDGVVHVVARSVNSMAARHTNAAGEWSASTETLATERPRSAARLAFDAQGNGFAVWRSRDADFYEMLLVSAFSKQDGAWSVATKLPGSMAPHAPATSEDNTYFRGEPSVAINDVGQAVALWVRGSDLGSELYASHFVDGIWQSPAKVSRVGGGLVYHEAPALVSVGSDFVVAWNQAIGTGVGAINHTYSARFDATRGTWSVPELRSDGESSGVKRMPRLGSDEHQNLLLVWARPTSEGIYELLQSRYVRATDAWYGPQPISAAAIQDLLFDRSAPDNTYTTPGYPSGLPFATAPNGISALVWANRHAGPSSEPQQDAKLGVFR